MDLRPISQLPWSTSWDDFKREADDLGDGGACCLFVIDDSIPADARGGYSALVIAYARSDEPVTILRDGGAALLIKEGGLDSARIVAERVIAQMRRLGLDQTLRAAVLAIGNDVEHAVEQARTIAGAVPTGGIAG